MPEKDKAKECLADIKGFDRKLPLGRYLSMLARNLFGALIKKLEHLGVERGFTILILIESAQSHCSQQFLSDFLKIDKATMVKRLDMLSKKGLIERKVNPADRREHSILLTKKGRAMLPEIHKAVHELNSAAFKGLSRKEIEEFYRMLGIIQHNIENMPVQKLIVNYKNA